MELQGQYTRDRDKKRKKWLDCSLSLDPEQRRVSVAEDGKFVCKGALDASQLQMLLEGSDIVLGYVTLRADVPAPVASSVPSRPKPSTTSHAPAVSTAAQPSSCTANTVLPTNSYVSAPTKPWTVPMLSTSAKFTAPSTKYGTDLKASSTLDLASPVERSELEEYFKLFSGRSSSRRAYIKYRQVFSTAREYAHHFCNALKEEVFIAMYRAMGQIERTCLASKSYSSKSSSIVSACKVLGSLYMTEAELIVSSDEENPRWTNTSKQKSYCEESEDNIADASAYDESAKLFLKLSRSDAAGLSLADRASMSKGDLWLVWSPTSPRINADLRSESAVKLSALSSRGYALPWLEGVLFQEVWVARALWHSVSSEGMLQLADLSGENRLPTYIGALPPGRVKGVLGKKFSCIRIASEGVSLTALDLLQSGASNPASVPSSTLSFGGLSESNVFQCIMNTPASFRSRQGVQAQPLVRNSSTAPAVFPVVDVSHAHAIIAAVSSYFRLNEHQCQVLDRIGKWFTEPDDCANDVILVHGVFGSGKSHLLCAALQLVNLLSKGTVKSLLAANTNVAVDRVLVQLMDMRSSSDWSEAVAEMASSCEPCTVIRVGCAGRVDKRLRSSLVLQADNTNSVKADLSKVIRSEGQDAALQSLLTDSDRSDFMARQKRRLVDAHVIGTTCASSVSAMLECLAFSVLIIDEASQITETTALLPLACARPSKMIIVGDPKQLPPIMTDRSSGSSALQRTLFDRLQANNWTCSMLRTQYRCHPAIADICSELFYENHVVSGVLPHQRAPLVGTLPPVTHLLNCGAETKRESSFVNTSEAELVREVVGQLLDFDSTLEIGVVCFYRPQVALITSLLSPIMELLDPCSGHVKVSTIDAFQGQEKDIIILATTRGEETSFLCDASRVNVAISRAKHHLMVIGQSMLFASGVWGKIISKSTRLQSISDIRPQVDPSKSFVQEEWIDESAAQSFLAEEVEDIPLSAPTSMKKSTEEIEESLARLDAMRNFKRQAAQSPMASASCKRRDISID